MGAVDQILEYLAKGAGAEYGSDRVTQLAHALQCASLAEEADANSALVAAALLHDIGHLVRRWDEGAKVPGKTTPDLVHFRRHL